MCWASTSSAPGRKMSGSSSRSSIASSAARASRYSKRLPGTTMPRLGSSSRWLARPMRWSRRDDPLGAPIWMTRSTSPQSMPEIEAGGGDQRAQPAVAHRRLDLAPCLQAEAAMVDADRQRLVVDLPQILENQFGQAAGVAEDKRGLVRLDQLHHLRGGIAARMARPGHAALGDQDREVGLGPGSPATSRTASISPPGASQAR